MPTYTYHCKQCDSEIETFMPIREYIAHPPVFVHCGAHMQRRLLPVQLAYVGEESYADLRAPDGTDISSRAKHREYMRAHNLTTVDDFAGTWKRDAEVRRARMEGMDPTRVQDVMHAVEKLGG